MLAALAALVVGATLLILEERVERGPGYKVPVMEAAVAVAVVRVTLVTAVTAVTAARAILLVHLALVVAQVAVVDRSLNGEAQEAV